MLQKSYTYMLYNTILEGNLAVVFLVQAPPGRIPHPVSPQPLDVGDQARLKFPPLYFPLLQEVAELLMHYGRLL